MRRLTQHRWGSAALSIGAAGLAWWAGRGITFIAMIADRVFQTLARAKGGAVQ